MKKQILILLIGAITLSSPALKAFLLWDSLRNSSVIKACTEPKYLIGGACALVLAAVGYKWWVSKNTKGTNSTDDASRYGQDVNLQDEDNLVELGLEDAVEEDASNNSQTADDADIEDADIEDEDETSGNALPIIDIACTVNKQSKTITIELSKTELPSEVQNSIKVHLLAALRMIQSGKQKLTREVNIRAAHFNNDKRYRISYGTITLNFQITANGTLNPLLSSQRKLIIQASRSSKDPVAANWYVL